MKRYNTEEVIAQTIQAISVGVSKFYVLGALFDMGFPKERANTIVRWAIRSCPSVR